ncbi:MK protein, partial [Scopus umbretta]|nr:MK protein [Scopus umbretta]
MQVRDLLLLLALILLAATAEAGKNKKEKAKKDGSECEDWRWGPCVPNSKDCGLGYREGTCKDESKKLKCKIPCNWKKKFGGEYMVAGDHPGWVAVSWPALTPLPSLPADCKYKFESWGACSAQTGVKTRSGILKKALYNAQCEEIVYVTKPCSSKIKSKSKGQSPPLLS